jgi:hypothetical protein
VSWRTASKATWHAHNLSLHQASAIDPDGTLPLNIGVGLRVAASSRRAASAVLQWRRFPSLLPPSSLAIDCFYRSGPLSAARWTLACVGHVWTGSFPPPASLPPICHQSPLADRRLMVACAKSAHVAPGATAGDLLPSPWTTPRARARTRSLSATASPRDARGRRLLAASAGLAHARPWHGRRCHGATRYR